jgi:DNA mismatch repair protein MutS
VLERLREEKAIEARGGGGGEPVQTVFDLSSGSFQQGDASADERATADGGAAGEESAEAATLDPDAEAVLDQLRDLDVNETPPVELMATVQEWQERVDGAND